MDAGRLCRFAEPKFERYAQLMQVRGHIQNGAVVLDEEASLPEGTFVEVTPISAPTGSASELAPTLLERFKAVAGKAQTLPPDAAANHDHYLHHHC